MLSIERQASVVKSPPTPGARARVRAELTDEIKAIARRHLAEQGAESLSLRAVAREQGMVSSAIYRYFPSRDQLLTALIVDSYRAVGAAAERADAACRRGDLAGRWLATARAIRRWALENPHEYALVYGSPIAGYAAPTDTIDPALGVVMVHIRLLIDAVEAGIAIATPAFETTRAVRADLAALRSTIAPDVPDGVLSHGLLVWMQLFGSISYELFGHFENVISDRDAFFDLQMRQAGRLLFAEGETG